MSGSRHAEPRLPATGSPASGYAGAIEKLPAG